MTALRWGDIGIWVDTGEYYRWLASVREEDITRFVSALPGNYHGHVYASYERVNSVYYVRLNSKGERS